MKKYLSLVTISKNPKQNDNIENIKQYDRNKILNNSKILTERDIKNRGNTKIHEKMQSRRVSASVQDVLQTNKNLYPKRQSQKENNYNGMKKKLMELEDRLLTLKNNYENSKKKKSSKKMKKISSSKVSIAQVHNKSTKYIKKEIQTADLSIATYSLSVKKQKQTKCVAVKPKIERRQAQKQNIYHKSEQVQKQQNSKINNNESQILSESYITQERDNNWHLQNKSAYNNIKLLKKCSSPSLNVVLEENFHNLYYYSSIKQALSTKTPNIFQQLCKNHFLHSFQLIKALKINNISKLPPQPSAKTLPPLTKPHTIIFDMDQTLIHCSQKTENGDLFDVKLPVVLNNRKRLTVGINIRPYTKQCLKELSKNFQIIIFTASHSAYANVVLDYLDPKKQYISHRFYREDCYKSKQGYYLKDLRVIDRQLQNILLVDNAIYSLCLQLENGIPIVPFYNNKADFELKSLVQYLNSLIGQKSLRKKNSQMLKLTQYTAFSNPEDLLNQICQ